MVYIYTPQDYHVHNHTWTEYPDEPCSPHCMIPARVDKSFAKFYLSNRLCQKHNSSLTGPWIYLSNRFSTLSKFIQVPRDMSFSNPIKPKSKAQSWNQRCPNSMPACGESACFYINNKGGCFPSKWPLLYKKLASII